jgi:uncharacterized protein (DUF427 family)
MSIPMAKAVWNGAVLADSNWCVLFDGITYFPADSVRWDFLTPSTSASTTTWIGRASYYNVAANGKTNRDAAWSYRSPVEPARHIRDHVAFWKGVQIKG